MTYLHALLFGILQGASEFFPISSSAHAALLRNYLGLESSAIFDLVLHAGTMCALLTYLRQELLVTRRYKALLLGTLPLVPLYFLIKPLLGNVNVGFFLVLTSLILFLAGKASRRAQSSQDPLWIGCAQALALFPGISRSASTITAAKRLGWPVEEAVIFSFLLSIPATCGGMCIETYSVWRSGALLPPIGVCILGFLAAFGVGLMMIRLAFRLLKRGKFTIFAWYCLLLGLFAIVTLYV
ncbi:MAG: undecaprenyl-diphosphate phosphatase [Chlamydiales bacterium]|nr:undecaprenyl-diphosphate phosphatase [Chlamydiales bacterium]